MSLIYLNPKGKTVQVKPDKIPGDTFTHKFVHKPVKVDRSLKMRNMSEFLSDAPLGRMLRGSAERTGKTYQSVPIYRMSKKMEIGEVKLNKGDHFYLDKLHGDHIEVFSKKGKLREEFVEDVEDNLEDSLEGFVRIAEGLLASDFGDLSVLENREHFGQRISILGVKIRRLQDDIENLGDLVKYVTHSVVGD